jgi:hypothetical protein
VLFEIGVAKDEVVRVEVEVEVEVEVGGSSLVVRRGDEGGVGIGVELEAELSFCALTEFSFFSLFEARIVDDVELFLTLSSTYEVPLG